MKSALAIVFHKIDRGVTTVDSFIDRYTINIDLFERITDMIPPEKCCTVSEYIKKQEGDWLILTFDDGNISDFEIAFPILRDKGIKATFFITTENIDRPGYLNLSHLKEMAKAGVEIGSHGLTHSYLISMKKQDAIREIKESKEKLEEAIGKGVVSFAPVGGHYRKWMEEFAFEVGYRAFATMIPGKTDGGGDLTVLRRNHIQSHHDAGYMSRLINGDYRTLAINRLRYNLLQIPKTILGLDNYDLLKKHLLGLLRTPY